jgi:hypothetical protein
MVMLWWAGCLLNVALTLFWMSVSLGDGGFPWDAVIFGVLSLAGFARLYPLARSYDHAGRH